MKPAENTLTHTSDHDSRPVERTFDPKNLSIFEICSLIDNHILAKCVIPFIVKGERTVYSILLKFMPVCKHILLNTFHVSNIDATINTEQKSVFLVFVVNRPDRKAVR